MIKWKAFVLALIMQESGGNDHAIGDHGASHGPLQIQKECIMDVNRYRKSKGWKQFKFPEDCYDRQKAEACLIIYTRIYANEKRVGRPPTLEDYARIWNGGPNGYKKQATLKYWDKLKKALEE